MTTQDDDSRSSGSGREAAASTETTHTIPNNTSDASTKPEQPPSTPTLPNAPANAKEEGSATSGPHSLAVSTSASATASPRSSRTSSPAGRLPRQQSAPIATTRGLRSRKNSHDISPQRPPSIAGDAQTVPSAAAIQRALSAANTPQLQPVNSTDPPSKLPRSARASEGNTPESTTPRWPISPRLKSPPPTSGSRRNSLQNQRKSNNTVAAPSIVVQGSSPNNSIEHIPAAGKSDGAETDEDQPVLTMKPSARGTSGPPKLETVQEGSQPSTPGHTTIKDLAAAFGSQPNGNSDEEAAKTAGASAPETPSKKMPKTAESGSDSGGKSDKDKHHEKDADSTPRPKTLATKGSQASLVLGKARAGPETATRNMTVETETVTSIPQPALGAPAERSGPSRTDPSGTLRVKTSTETIRPKKERKKPSRKAPSITSGTASSRADIFEAKVASAVDQADSSDSDETFVYESNPPDPPPRRSRHHSRTPSATSMTSLVDPHRNATRNIGSFFDSQRGVAGKRSMKFSSNAYNSPGGSDEANDRKDGTVRAGNMRSGGGSSIHHHHVRRNQNHASILDDESPFTGLHKVRSLQGNGFRHGSRPQSPRVGAPTVKIPKNELNYVSYDMDGEGADDEQTPLLGTVRTTPRTPHAQRTPRSFRMRHLEHYERRRGCLSRFAGIFLLIFVTALLALGAIAAVVAASKPLEDVHIEEIQDVLASESEIMLNLYVGAVNPNALTVNIDDMDVNIFAKSKYVGSEKWWREHPEFGSITDARRRRRKAPAIKPNTPKNTTIPDSVRAYDDDPADPFPEDPDGSQTMLLGRIFHFDNALSFEGSFFQRNYYYSLGSVRLQKPGNKTEMGGTERWERVIKHPFELIVRGVLKYNLPVGGRAQRAPIDASVMVHPEANTPTDNDEKNLDRNGKIVIAPPLEKRESRARSAV